MFAFASTSSSHTLSQHTWHQLHTNDTDIEKLLLSYDITTEVYVEQGIEGFDSYLKYVNPLVPVAKSSKQKLIYN